MGELIVLKERLADRSRPTRSLRPAFFFDLSCPFSYLAAERVERVLGEVDWVPTAAGALHQGYDGGDLGRIRAEAELAALALRVPLVWPERFPAQCPSALRAASYAHEMGAGAGFVLAASRLAFCGGFDLEDPEILAEAAAAAGMLLEECLAAAGDAKRDRALNATAQGLLARGVKSVPAVRVGRWWFDGEQALGEAAAMLRARTAQETSGTLDRPLAPVG
jgi:2-hydroxychromene-2-carboxylate isomerase